ncbi:MAG: efflux RND transporter periplasmic adaptor subunit [Calditrichae bacterium]|nr:efflux RND transporter periplasmic adaptor subunit [Calditrichota bacterium]MCB9057561.1 efflux RND transporter periplasmic adaptor subunit [Calditrichia bacterium]
MFYKIMIVCFCLFILIACSENQAGTENNENTVEKKAGTEKARIPVEAGIVKKAITKQEIPLTGIVQPIYEVNVVSETSGQVKQISKNIGDYVSRKDTIAYIDDRVPLSQYRQAQAQVLSAKNNLEIARLNLESDQELFKNGDISRLEYENSELAVKTSEASHLSALANLSLAEKAFLDTRIVSPISGHIARRFIENGTMVSAGMNLFRVVDLSTLKVMVGLPQNIVNQVTAGSSANISISSMNNKKFRGTIRHISPQADESNGTFMAEVHFENTTDNPVRAGMAAKVAVLVTSAEKQLVVPDYAIISKNGSNSLYRVNQNYAELIPVSIENTIGSHVVIGSGIAEGDTIVVVGMKNLGLNTPIWIETIHN